MHHIDLIITHVFWNKIFITIYGINVAMQRQKMSLVYAMKYEEGLKYDFRALK
jgi:hypothetical protein